MPNPNSLWKAWEEDMEAERGLASEVEFATSMDPKFVAARAKREATDSTPALPPHALNRTRSKRRPRPKLRGKRC